MNTSERVDQVGPAWVKALRDIPHVRRDAQGHHGGYVTLRAVLDAAAPVLEANGLAIQQWHRLPTIGNGVEVVTRVWHESGQWIEDEGFWMPAPNDPQKVGGAATYARRYALFTFLAVVTDDDDGQAATDELRHEIDAANELDGRIRDVMADLRNLDSDGQAAIKEWANDRPLTGNAFRDVDWLTLVEAWLDEHNPKEGGG